MVEDCRTIFTTAMLALAPLSYAEQAEKTEPKTDWSKKYVLENTHTIAMHSEHTGQDHELIVALPYSYGDKPDKKYPVLYFMDAYWDMPLLSASYGSLYYDNLIPEFIMVGFSYPSGKDYGLEWQRDFSPKTKDNPKGASDKFYSFVTQQAVPFIDKHYRTLPGQRALAGSSLGGLFTLTSMYKSEQVFSRFLAISPCVFGYEKYVSDLDGKRAKAKITINASSMFPMEPKKHNDLPPLSSSIKNCWKNVTINGWNQLVRRSLDYGMLQLKMRATQKGWPGSGVIWLNRENQDWKKNWIILSAGKLSVLA